MFAGSCIGVILLVMVLESVRRLAGDYDQYIVRNHFSRSTPTGSVSGTGSGDDTAAKKAVVDWRLIYSQYHAAGYPSDHSHVSVRGCLHCHVACYVSFLEL